MWQIAGLEHEPAQAAPAKQAVPRDDWSRQLEKVYSNAGSSSGGRSSHRESSNRDSNPMVKIVGYDSPAQQSNYGYKNQENGRYRQQAPLSRPDYNEYTGSLNPSNISGKLL